jgi:hypothetical protein
VQPTEFVKAAFRKQNIHVARRAPIVVGIQRHSPDDRVRDPSFLQAPDETAHGFVNFVLALEEHADLLESISKAYWSLRVMVSRLLVLHRILPSFLPNGRGSESRP